MPQMAPLSWTMLMIMFITIFIMFNSMNYFLVKYKNNSKTTKSMKKTFNWKW